MFTICDPSTETVHVPYFPNLLFKTCQCPVARLTFHPYRAPVCTKMRESLCFLFPFRSIIGPRFSKQRDWERCWEKAREGKAVGAMNSLTYSNCIFVVNFSFPICKSFHKQLASVRLVEPVLGTPTALVPAEHFSPAVAAWDHLLLAWFRCWFGDWGANGG